MPREQRFSFDEVAELYERARPSYPEALVEDVLTLSGVGPQERILEIGCGTGLATRSFAAHGFRMTCLEPGDAMARVARAALSAFRKVEIVPVTFEAWPLEAEAFGLVFAAQAFHWVPREIGCAKAAQALRPGGGLAVFGNAPVEDPSVLRSAIDEAYARHAPSLAGGSAARWYAASGIVADVLAESARFGPLVHRSYPWSRRYTGGEYTDLLCTSSDHRMLSPEQRDALLAAIRDAIDAHGGCFDVRYEAHLHLARRA